MQAFKCDVCGTYYEPYNYYGNQDCSAPNAIIFANDNAARTKTYGEKFDLCPDCMEAFKTLTKLRGRLGRKDDSS